MECRALKGKSDKDLWSLLYDPKVRSYFAQGFLLLFIVLVGYEIVTNTIENLQRQQIASGFGFFDQRAGYLPNQILIPHTEESSYGRLFFVGLLNTLLVAVIGIVLATIIGFLIGIGRLSDNPLIAGLSGAYVEVIRNLPPLLLIFFIYNVVLLTLPLPKNSFEIAGTFYLNRRGFFGPEPVFLDGFLWVFMAFLLGAGVYIFARRWAARKKNTQGYAPSIFWISVGALAGFPLVVFLLAGAPLDFDLPRQTKFNLAGGLRIIPEFIGLTLALALYTASFIAEIVRAGILSVHKGQSEAARSLGLSSGKTLSLVIVPQALRVIIPPLTSQYLNLTKNSSLAVAIAYPDLVSVFAGVTLNNTGQAVEIILLTMAVYLTISILTAIGMNWYNARIKLTER